MKNLTAKILKFQPITFVLFFIILPLISLIITGIMSLIGIFADFEFVFPLILITCTIAASIYLIWIWGIVYYTGQIQHPQYPDIRYFKISYWIIVSWFVLLFIKNLELDIFYKQILLDNSIWALIGFVVSIYMLIVLGCYIYVSYFVAKRIMIILEGNSTPEFFFFAAVWCFPIGIPFLQAQLLKQKTIFDLVYKPQ
ncbi:hypothetical protein [Flavobacterium gelatinilyticum]|uniref:hypothetical protein n=1 Tax=Flavobacterium gelatinilyticum TaxID=3003260 RepID=UPI0024805374|nr:hypothetical protein [Flavobacterium gelatinilyticum]